MANAPSFSICVFTITQRTVSSISLTLCPYFPTPQMADDSSPEYKTPSLQERWKRIEDERLREDRRRGKAEDEDRQEKARRQTTFVEFVHYYHQILSRPLKVATPSHSISETIPLPRVRFCPTRLRPWTDCLAQQQDIYNSVCNHLKSSEEPPARPFPPQ